MIEHSTIRNVLIVIIIAFFIATVIFLSDLIPWWERSAEGAEIVVETIALESSSEPFEAQVMVAQVILTRAKERGLTLKEVVLQPYQFSCHNKGIRKSIRKRLPWELLKAQKALSRARSATNLPKVNLYHDTSIKAPYWAKSVKVKFVKQIGKLRFYYES